MRSVPTFYEKLKLSIGVGFLLSFKLNPNYPPVLLPTKKDSYLRAINR